VVATSRPGAYGGGIKTGRDGPPLPPAGEGWGEGLLPDAGCRPGPTHRTSNLNEDGIRPGNRARKVLFLGCMDSCFRRNNGEGEVLAEPDLRPAAVSVREPDAPTGVIPGGDPGSIQP